MAFGGAEIFVNQCSAYYRPKGQGAAGQFPAFAHGKDIFLSREFPVRVALAGLSGKITG